MFVLSVVSFIFGVLFAALWFSRRNPGAVLAAISWLLYAPYEYLMYLRILCSGECNIRVDLLLIWPLLLIVTLAAPARWIASKFNS